MNYSLKDGMTFCNSINMNQYAKIRCMDFQAHRIIVKLSAHYQNLYMANEAIAQQHGLQISSVQFDGRQVSLVRLPEQGHFGFVEVTPGYYELFLYDEPYPQDKDFMEHILFEVKQKFHRFSEKFISFSKR